MRRFKRTKWGWWLVLVDRKQFKVKLLKFKDRCTCSLQYHKDREELWLFLSGMGRFHKTGYMEFVCKGDYVHVGKLQTHRFVSIGCSLVLEIQYGERCIEEDITRL